MKEMLWLQSRRIFQWRQGEPVAGNWASRKCGGIGHIKVKHPQVKQGSDGGSGSTAKVLLVETEVLVAAEVVVEISVDMERN